MAVSNSKKSSSKKTNSSRNTTTSKRGSYKTPGKSNSNADKGKAITEEEQKLRRDLSFWLSILAVIFCYACFIGLISGGFGVFVKKVFVGLFGLIGYLMPILLFICIWFFIANKNKGKSLVKILSSFLLVINMGIFIALVSTPSVADLSLREDFIKSVYEAGKGGGVLFGGLAYLLFKWIGNAGSIIVSILLVIMSTCLLSGKSITAFASKIFNGELDLRGSEEADEDDDDKELINRKKVKLIEEKHTKQLAIPDLTPDEKGFVQEESREEIERKKNERNEKREKAREIRLERELEEKRNAERREDERIVNASYKSGKRQNFVISDLNSDKFSNKDDLHQINVVSDADSTEVSTVNPADLPVSHKPSRHSTVMTEINPESFGIKPVNTEPANKIDTQILSAEKDAKLHNRDNDDANDNNNDIFVAVAPGDTKDLNKDINSKEFNEALDKNDNSRKAAASDEVVRINDPNSYISLNSSDKGDKKTDKNQSSSVSIFDTAKINAMPDPVTERTHKKAEDNNSISDNPTSDNNKIRKIVHDRNSYKPPIIDLLKVNKKKNTGDTDKELKTTALKLQDTLKTFGVGAQVTDISQGPSVTRYELTLDVGVKVNKVVSLVDDIKLNLAAADIRIEAPIPGKAAVGIEVPNKEASDVGIRELIESSEFKKATSNISFAVGKDISGQTIVSDIAKMPHMLIAGATGSGKSVFINTLIMSILYKAHPDDVKLLMIDPKVVELSVYNGIPHLCIPVVTDPKKASAALKWAVDEMISRYNSFAAVGVRDLKGFNEKAAEMKQSGEENAPHIMPQIVVIVDELADLMMVASKEVEESICRLAQLARAAGIHLIIATQRPSVDVITGLIKANMPSRVACKVSSGVDSRTILDMVGAERLLGKGDMLFFPQGYNKPLRVQGAYISDEEVSRVVDYLKDNNSEYQTDYDVENKISSSTEGNNDGSSSAQGQPKSDYDEYFKEACRLVVDKGSASSGMLQRVYRIGFNRAARMVDQMENLGIVSGEMGTKARTVLVDSFTLEDILSKIQ